MCYLRYTYLILQACNRHNTAPTASAALGRALLGTLLISSFKAEGEKTQVINLWNLHDLKAVHQSLLLDGHSHMYGFHRALSNIKVQVTFRGNGMLEGIQAIAEATGMVKGKVGNPAADPPLQPSGKLDVGGAVGRGQALQHPIFFHHFPPARLLAVWAAQAAGSLVDYLPW